MKKVAYIDDDKGEFEDYKEIFFQHGIELIFVDWKLSMLEIVDWIGKNQIECMLVDYQLKREYEFLGTELVALLNYELPDFQCLMLTSHADEAIAENLVQESLFIEREDLDDPNSDEFMKVIEKTAQAAEVFKKRMQSRLKDFIQLKAEREVAELSTDKEEHFLSLYKILKTYGEVDPIPLELLKSDTLKEMQGLLEELRNITTEEEEECEYMDPSN